MIVAVPVWLVCVFAVPWMHCVSRDFYIHQSRNERSTLSYELNLQHYAKNNTKNTRSLFFTHTNNPILNYYYYLLLYVTLHQSSLSIHPSLFLSLLYQL
ncbi:hypothetical protein BDA99DRAFT_514935 [Phascolomyces articulosus]|uniref:Secreted protein n=1 Tax=Phascolomyces articulosus TaxID=60185 RepID=A0AAD5JWF4_9FUNG|nr:hypothetical protein BDA99DRAFT_514935 [Phascolomyces articulosus]